MSDKHSDNRQDSSLRRSIAAVLKRQVLSTALLLVVIVLAGLATPGSAGPELLEQVVSAGYGALLAVLATLITARSVRQASLQASRQAGGQHDDNGETGVQAPGQQPISLAPVFVGLLNKLIIIGGGIGLGLIVFQFNPILVVVGFLLVQLAPASLSSKQLDSGDS